VRVHPGLQRMGLAPMAAPVASAKRFPDGAEFRMEIPSVEGPRVLAEVIAAAASAGVVVNRVSQGSGGMLLTGAELAEMAALASDAGMEVALFVGPRAGFDTGGLVRAPGGAVHYGAVRGLRQIGYAVADVERCVEAGIRSFLVADLGLLAVLVDLQRSGDLPAEIVWKVSAYLASSNAATLRVLERMGAGTVNIASDVTLNQLAEMRAHVEIPIDLYLETPDAMGGFVRGQEIADFVEAGAPLYIKMGLRNARNAYPSGEHLVGDAIAAAREKVHRCAVALEWLERERPGSVQSRPHAKGMAIPVVPA
jgi:Peptidase family U32